MSKCLGSGGNLSLVHRGWGRGCRGGSLPSFAIFATEIRSSWSAWAKLWALEEVWKSLTGFGDRDVFCTFRNISGQRAFLVRGTFWGIGRGLSLTLRSRRRSYGWKGAATLHLKLVHSPLRLEKSATQWQDDTFSKSHRLGLLRLAPKGILHTFGPSYIKSKSILIDPQFWGQMGLNRFLKLYQTLKVSTSSFGSTRFGQFSKICCLFSACSEQETKLLRKHASLWAWEVGEKRWVKREVEGWTFGRSDLIFQWIFCGKPLHKYRMEGERVGRVSKICRKLKDSC